MDDSSLPVIEIKVCALGTKSSGKTSLTLRYCERDDPTKRQSRGVIGASFLQKRHTTADGIPLSLQIWDTAGQERYRSMAPMYYRGARLAICVFNPASRDTFAFIQDYVRELQRNGMLNVIISIVANLMPFEVEDEESKENNKEDREYTPPIVLPIIDSLLEEAKEYAFSIGALYFECNSVADVGVDEIFEVSAEEIVEKQLKQDPKYDKYFNDSALKVTEDVHYSPQQLVIKWENIIRKNNVIAAKKLYKTHPIEVRDLTVNLIRLFSIHIYVI